MDNNLMDLDEKFETYSQNSNLNFKVSLEILNNYQNPFPINIKNCPLLNEEKSINLFKSLNLNDFNDTYEIYSKDSENANDKKLKLKRKRIEKNIHNNLRNNLIRRAKRILYDSILEYINKMISDIYGNKIGKGINSKKLLKIAYDQIRNTNVKINQKLLNTSLGDIFSDKISPKFINLPSDYNKKIINRLLNEKDIEKKNKFINLFNKTFSECIQQIMGNKKFECLKGLENIFEIEMKNLDDSEEFKNEIRKEINNFEKIFNEKKSRKVKVKK